MPCAALDMGCRPRVTQSQMALPLPVSELSVSILIPAYNEEGAIAETVETVRRQAVYFKELEIVVINDGTDDRTGEIARALPVTLIEHPVNSGYGAALKTGMQHARFEYILIADADGTYPLEDIPKLMADAQTHDMVVGARTGRSTRCRWCGVRRSGSSRGWPST